MGEHVSTHRFDEEVDRWSVRNALPVAGERIRPTPPAGLDGDVPTAHDAPVVMCSGEPAGGHRCTLYL